jgi:3-dehydroquinate dehydratase
MICIPIVAGSRAEALQEMEKSLSLTDILELRMDLINGGNLEELINLARSGPRPVKIIVTNRRKDEEKAGLSLYSGRDTGVPMEERDAGEERRRVAVLMEAVILGADYVDIELDTGDALKRELLSRIMDHGNRTQLIVSHHDFTKTPSVQKLREIFQEAVKAGAGIVKVVTFAGAPKDNLRVLGLIPYARRKKREIIAFCMGEEGRMSRVMAPLLGSLLTFASSREGSESAAGQLTAGEMREIFRILKVER